MNLTPYDRECIVIGAMLTYAEAPDLLLPELTHDKFIFSREGGVGVRPDHLYVWQAIQLCRADGVEINPANVADRCPPSSRDGIRPHLITLRDKLAKHYGFREYDPRAIQGYATAVDQAGIMYRFAARAMETGRIIETPESFNKALAEVDNVDAWLNDMFTELQGVVTPANQGYRHISEVSEEALSYLDDVESGRQLSLLPCGMTPLLQASLFPTATLAILHGMSGSGKSNVAHAVNVGTAMGLMVNNIKGCVAIHSLEMSARNLLLRTASALSGYDKMNLIREDKKLTSEEYARFKEWVKVASRLPIYVDDRTLIEASAAEWQASSLHASDKGPVWQISVDYIELHKLSGESKEQALDEVIHRYFGVTRKAGANVIMLSQSTYGDGYSKFRIAGPSGTRYSRSIQHSGDIIIEVWNPIAMRRAGIDFETPDFLDEHHLWLLIQKFRDGPVGEHVKLGWEPEFTRIYQPATQATVWDGTIIYNHMKQVEELLGFGNTLVVDPMDTEIGYDSF